LPPEAPAQDVRHSICQPICQPICKSEAARHEVHS
jgi:hypothetical protein